MGWGSGTANFPYLITPLTAIQNEVRSQGGNIEDVLDNYAYAQIDALAQRVDEVDGVALVFVNSDSGEGYIIVDGNEGDRNNLTLWQGGDKLIENITALCSNVIVVMHTVGPVLVDAWYDNPNVTAIIWAGIPGQESGNSIADILYGRVNPSGKLPFTFGRYRGQYGADILYNPNNGYVIFHLVSSGSLQMLTSFAVAPLRKMISPTESSSTTEYLTVSIAKSHYISYRIPTDISRNRPQRNTNL